MPKILIVDDDFTIKLELEEMLTTIGYDVVGTAENGEQAVEMAKALVPDLIIMDVNMPGNMDGISAAEKIKQTSDIAIIFITGYGDPEYLERAKRVEPFGYVMKPFDEKEINAAVEIALYKKQAELKLKRAHHELENEIEERKKIEKGLHESEEKYRHLLNHAPSGIFEVDFVKQRFVKVNDTICEFTAYTKEEMLSMSPFDILAEDSKQIFRERLTRLFAGKTVPENVEYKIYGKDGREFWAILKTKFLWEDEKPKGAIVVVHDITERKHAEEALRQREEKFKLLFDNAPVGYQSLDKNGCFLDVNQAWLDILGYERHEIIGKWFGDFLPPDLVDIFKQRFKQNIRSRGLIENVEFPLVRKDGSIVLADYMARIGRDQEGRFLRTHCAFSDITEKKRTEQALKDSEEKYRELVENINDVIISLDAKGTVTYVSPTIETVIGTPPSEAIGRHMTEFIAPEDRVALEERFKELVLSGRIKPTEYRILDKSGNRRWVRSSSRPIVRDGRISGIQGVLTDISQNKELEERLRHVQKMEAIATLAGGIAHDYNNLLAVIMGNLSMAQEETDPHSTMAELLQEIEQASYRARDLTHQFLALSKGGHSRKKLGTIESLLREIQEQTQTNEHIEYIFSIQDDLWSVEYDAKQMQDAMTNILKNAMEAMPQGGAITVHAENRIIDNKEKDPALPLNGGKYLRISIEDKGPGIPKENMDKVFDPYFSTKERGVQKGMGLGLTSAYAVVEKHGGHIMLSSATGVGTTVNIYLPAYDFGLGNSVPQGGIDSKKGEEPKQQASQSSVRRILVMDDEENLRTLAKKMLERLGYEVVIVKDGAEALGEYKKYMDSGVPFDAVILDLTIKGGMGGEKTIRELLKIDSDVKAIVSSGYYNDSVLADFAKYGFKGAMAKPYRKDDLENVLKTIL